MKRILFLVVLLSVVPRTVYAQQTTVTGTIQTPTGVAATSGYIEFRLRPSSSSIAYRVTGTAAIAPQTSRCRISSAGQVVGPNGTGSCLVWGNTTILPGNSCYDIAIAPNNTQTSLVQSQLISTGTYDLSNPKFCPQVNIVPQYQTITTAPINANLVPAADKVFNLGDNQHYYAQAYIDNLTANNISGNVALPANANFRSINNVLKCDSPSFTGTDVGSKLQSCHDALPVTGGVMDACGFQGTQAWNTLLQINKPNTQLRLCAATFTLSASGGIAINNSRVGIVGMGQHQTTFQYGKFAPGSVLTMSCGAITCAQNYLQGISFDALGDTAGAKIAMDILDAEEAIIRDISVSNWHDTGNLSVGLKIHGRQTYDVHDLEIFADNPFNITLDPNVTSIGLDHSHFYNIYACNCVNSASVSTAPVWKVDTGVILTNNTWDGYQAWIGGTYGFYYASASEMVTGYMNKISNCRTEQSTNVAGAGIYYAPSGSFNLTIENCRLSAYVNQPGIFVRNQVSARIMGNQYANTGVALNVDGSVYYMAENNDWNRGNGSTLSVAGSHPSLWCGNDEIGQFAVSPQCGIGVTEPNASLVIRNTQSLAGRNAAGSADIPLISLDNTNAVAIAPSGGQTHVSGPLAIGGDFPHSQIVSIPPTASYGIQNAGNTDSIPIVGRSGTNLSFDPSSVGSLFGSTVDAASGFKAAGTAGFSGVVNVRRADDTGGCVISVLGGIITGTNCP